MRIAICAIIKDVYPPYYKEWIDYHRSIGVDYFFIYDNDSADPIQPDNENGIYVIKSPGDSQQLPSYDHCLQSIKTQHLPSCDRVAFIDEDEFIRCENGNLKKTLKQYGACAGIGLNWRTFGSSGIMHKTEQPQTEKFRWHSGPEDVVNQHIKSIVDPMRAIGHAGNPHCFSYLSGYCVNVYHEPIEGPFSRVIHRIMWVDHYYTRSFEEWKEKMERGRSDIKDGGRAWEAFDSTNAYCLYNLDDEKQRGRTAPRNIHLVMPFWRKEQRDILIEAYRPMNIIMHPIMFQDEVVDWKEDDWIHPVVVPMDAKDSIAGYPGTLKRNWFIASYPINDDDYYVCVDDDDMYEANVFEELRWMPDDITIISMKRGNHVPRDAEEIRRYPVSTLVAKPNNISIRSISGQQCFICGRLFKSFRLNENSGVWDGEMIVHHKEAGERFAYRPDLFAQFNFYEPGRWDPPYKIAFGALVNNEHRFEMVLQQSELSGFPLEVVYNPETACKGLNRLLATMEEKGYEIAVLAHQDVFFRSWWVAQMREQIELLPDSWIVAGVIGKDMQGKICGKMQDMRMPLAFNTSHYQPQMASCFDECVIIVNLKKGFRFDEGLPGFDLYGTLCVCQAWEMGGSAWIISAFTEHYCTRSFDWFPGKDFEESFQWLHKRFAKSVAERIDTTVLGVRDSLPRYDDEFDGDYGQSAIQAEAAYRMSRGIGTIEQTG